MQNGCNRFAKALRGVGCICHVHTLKAVTAQQLLASCHQRIMVGGCHANASQTVKAY